MHELTDLPEGEHEVEILEVLGHGTWPDEWTILKIKPADAESEPIVTQIEEILLPRGLSRYDLRQGMRMILTVGQVKTTATITKIESSKVGKLSCLGYL